MGEFSKIPKDHVENSKATTSPPSSFPFYHDSQLQVSAFHPCKYLALSSFISPLISLSSLLSHKRLCEVSLGESLLSHIVSSFVYLSLSLMHSIVHTYQKKMKNLVASFASVGLSLEAFRLHSCIGRNLVKNTCLELDSTS